MFKKLFQKRQENNVHSAIDSTHPPSNKPPQKVQILKMSDLPAYMEKRLLELHEAYSNLINILAENNTLSDIALASGKRILDHRIGAGNRPELNYLLTDQSKAGVLKAIKYLDREVLDSLETYKKTGKLANNKIWE